MHYVLQYVTFVFHFILKDLMAQKAEGEEEVRLDYQEELVLQDFLVLLV